MGVTILGIPKRIHQSGVAVEATVTGTIKEPYPSVQTIVITQGKADGVEITITGTQGIMVVEDQAETLMAVEGQVEILMVVVAQVGITIHRTLRTTTIMVQHLK